MLIKINHILDGTPSLFYQKFWKRVGGDVTELVLNILNHDGDPTELNSTFISLIPKVKQPVHPIVISGLCNVIFKVVTKTIANRLKLILSSIVSESSVPIF